MEREHDTMMNPPIEELLDRVDSKFGLVTLAARRARNINAYFNQLGEGLGHMVPPQVVVGRPQAAEHRLPGDRRRQDRVDRPARGGRGDRRGRRGGRGQPSPSPDRPAMLAGARIVLGVTGGIAAYKAVEVCRRLVDAGAHVMPVMTKGAEHFIGRTTLSALASEPVQTSLWDGPTPIPHTRLGQTADLVDRRPGDGPPARALRRRAVDRPAHQRAAGHRVRRCWSARRCTPRCGSTRPSPRTWRRCAAAASTSSSPASVASPAATRAPAASPTRPTSSPPPTASSTRRPRPRSTPPSSSPPAAPASRSTPCA